MTHMHRQIYKLFLYNIMYSIKVLERLSAYLMSTFFSHPVVLVLKYKLLKWEWYGLVNLLQSHFTVRHTLYTNWIPDASLKTNFKTLSNQRLCLQNKTSHQQKLFISQPPVFCTKQFKQTQSLPWGTV